ncbi:MAG: YhdT family protein [Firmicutes bacterium]|nr:YhdT family protein [Bacillota bacterium]
MKEINKQLKKEALLTALLYVLFFIWWYATAYGFADSPVRVLGLPLWFFLSCIVGWLLCVAGTVILVKKGFKNIDLNQFDEDPNATTQTANDGEEAHHA